MHFRVKDVFRLGELRKIKDMRFTWDNKSDSPHMIKSRIDRIHARENTIKKGGLSRIWTPLPTTSSHSLIFIRVMSLLKLSRPKSAFFRSPIKVEMGKQGMLTAWRQTLEE